MNETKIQWADFTSNPIRYRRKDTGAVVWACIHASPGCVNCYAEATAKRLNRGSAFNVQNMDGLEVYVDQKELGTLLASPKLTGKKVFVGDMTDVFGEWVPEEMIAQLFWTFAYRSDVTWQVLTKRIGRMKEIAGRLNSTAAPPFRALPNLWLGVSVESQEWADERIPLLLQTPAAVRFLSCEPLLGPVEIWPEQLQPAVQCTACGCRMFPWRAQEKGHCYACGESLAGVGQTPGIDWVIGGGESGPGARPCDLAWVRGIIEQCKAAGVPAFVKQLGGNPGTYREIHATDGLPGWFRERLQDHKGGNVDEWPEDLRVREFPRGTS